MLFKDRAIIRLETADSTNNYAANLIRLSSAPEGTVITAQYQSSGKGQRGTEWESAPGVNLLCSVVLYPRFLQAHQQFLLSQTIALALLELIETISGKEVYVKWPNDIIVENRKIAGVLLETAWSGKKMQSAIAGIGINLNQETFHSPNAISLLQIIGKILPVDECLTLLIPCIEKHYLRLHAGLHAEIRKSYKENLYRAGQVGRYFYQGKQVDAMIIDVDNDGHLRLQVEDGSHISCELKEIAMVW